MRVLLDENLDWRLVRHFDTDFQVTTVSRQGWKGKRNGELLAQAAKVFDALVTMDKGIEHEQNLRKYTISIISHLCQKQSDPGHSARYVQSQSNP